MKPTFPCRLSTTCPPLAKPSISTSSLSSAKTRICCLDSPRPRSAPPSANGAKTALGILSARNADELAQAVAEEDVKRLSSAPGIGKKTAERMVLELRGKLVSHTVSDGLFAPDAVADESQDIINTLLALGYNEREAKAATKGIPKGTEVGEGVRLALKNLLK